MAAHVQTRTATGDSAAPQVTLLAAPLEGSALTAVVVTNQNKVQTVAASWTRISGPNDVRSNVYHKVAGAVESTTQAPCTMVAGEWECGIIEHSGTLATSPLDVSGTNADASTPVDLTAINPTDSIPAVLMGIAIAAGNAPTWSGQTIGGVAADERADAAGHSSESFTIFDRLNVDTGAGTWAAQATASANPSNGAIYLLIYKLQPDATILATVAAVAFAVLTPSVLIGYTLPLTVLTVPARPRTLTVEVG